jgi:AcrR family transcriptional regulator
MSEPNRLGRPPRVTPAQIAEAALAVGLEKATVRKVAGRLGMSVPGLYHHVRTREELLAMAAAHSFRALLFPDPAGKTWIEWLCAYGRDIFDTLVAQPEFVGRMMAATTNPATHAQHLERFFEVLGSHGFSVTEAYEIYCQLMATVIGAAVLEIRDRAGAASGRTLFSDLGTASQSLGGEATPLVRGLVDAGHDPADRFETVRFTLEGIAARRASRRSIALAEPAS